VNTNGTVLIIGGSSGIGLAVARRCLADGARVVIAGRSEDRLGAARAELARAERTAERTAESTAERTAERTAESTAERTAERTAESTAAGRLTAFSADIGNLGQVEALFERVGTLSHLVVTAADLPYGPAVTLTEDSMMRAVRSKVLGPFFAAQQAAARMTAPGSITFTSGVAAYRPAPGGALAATVNGALESMVRALALELAPIRVNAVSPGWVDTPAWEHLATPEARQARMADLAARLPARRIGRPDDIANAVSFLISDDFVTGTVLHAEGAQLIV
jgi:NAD(P)-dependent dehydrogenase (short-subunit alcohol dehydrogenase family)